MISDASGAAGLYRGLSDGGNDSDIVGVKLRQLYLDAVWFRIFTPGSVARTSTWEHSPAIQSRIGST